MFCFWGNLWCWTRIWHQKWRIRPGFWDPVCLCVVSEGHTVYTAFHKGIWHGWRSNTYIQLIINTFARKWWWNSLGSILRKTSQKSKWTCYGTTEPWVHKCQWKSITSTPTANSSTKILETLQNKHGKRYQDIGCDGEQVPEQFWSQNDGWLLLDQGELEQERRKNITSRLF